MPFPRSLTAIATAAAMVLAGACDGGSGDQPDQGQTRITLAAAAAGGGAATPDALAQAGEVLSRRFADAGLPDPVAEPTDAGLVVTVAGDADEELVRSLVVPGELRFRKVLALREGESGGIDDVESQTPAPADGDQGSRLEREAAFAEKVGDAAMAVAQSLVEGELAGDEAELAAALDRFGELMPAEVAVLPATYQWHLQSISCTRLGARPYGSAVQPDRLVTACDHTRTKYLLDVAAVTGANVADAEASQEPTTGQWMVTLSFTGAGQQRWTALTREAVGNDGEPFDPTALGPADRYEGPSPIQCEATGDTGNCLVAVVLDNVVLTAPQITDVINGPAQITGNFTERAAERLATQLRFGPLPLVLTVESVEHQPRAG